MFLSVVQALTGNISIFGVHEGGQGLQNFRTGPVLRAHVFADDATGAVDQIAFRYLHSAIIMLGLLGRFADGWEADAVFQQEISICLRVGVNTYAENDQAG